jgi:hypothetical protein
MKSWRTAVTALLAAVVPFGAAAQNLLTNGSFEAGLGGWTSSGGACSPSAQPAGGTSTGAGAWTAPAPVDGAAVYMGDTGTPGTCTFFQDVALPANVSSGQLTYAAGYNFNQLGPPGAAGCSASVAVTTPANVPLAVGYTQTGSTVSDPLAPRPVLQFTAPAPGATVRVLITEVSCAGGPVGIVGDAFALTTSTSVPALDDWAKAVLALLLAATAATHLRRRAQP